MPGRNWIVHSRLPSLTPAPPCLYCCALPAVGTQQVRIDKSIGDVDLLDLDPQLSKALLAYPHCDPPGTAPSFAPFQAAQPAGSSAPAQAQAAHGAAAAGGGQTAAAQQVEQVQQAQQDGLEAAGSSTAAQQAAGVAGLSPRSPADAAAAQHKWEAFSAQSNRCLLSAPSPFDSPAPAPAPMRAPARPLQMSATFDVAQLTALRQQAAAAAAGAAGGQRGAGRPSQLQQPQQQQSAPTPALGGSLVGSYGSFQLAEQPSALPLVLPSGQAKAAGSNGGSDGGQASGSTPRKGFLGLFQRSATPEQQASSGQAGSAAGSHLIQARLCCCCCCLGRLGLMQVAEALLGCLRGAAWDGKAGAWEPQQSSSTPDDPPNSAPPSIPVCRKCPPATAAAWRQC